MSSFLRLYFLEILVVIVGTAVTGGVYLVFSKLLEINPNELQYVSLANTGMLFIIGHVYSRLKDRRDGRRRRAQELFLEWHSKDIRDSRIFVSRWVDVHGKDNLPSLGVLEKEAAAAYRKRYDQSVVVAKSEGSTLISPLPHALDDPELKEFHFFRIYQFFERWAQLVKNSDIDHAVACDYMSSYKSWYLERYIKPWSMSEKDPYICNQLNNILKHIAPPNAEAISTNIKPKSESNGKERS